MSRSTAIALTSGVAVITSLLTACAARRPSAAPGPYVIESTGGRSAAYKKVDGDKRNEPTTIAGWEARLQSQVALLRTITDAPPPAAPPVSVSPGPAPARPSAPGAGSRAPKRRTVASKQTLRCRRICKHVQAICYAARRICQIAGRLGDADSRQACRRNRKRCKDARDTTARQGCLGCGSASRRRGKPTRRACYARALPFGL